MPQQYTALLLGPPVDSPEAILHLLEWLLSRWTGKDGLNIEQVCVVGPVPYKTQWMKPITATNSLRRQSSQECNLWRLRFSSDVLQLDLGLSLLVQDSGYWLQPHAQRQLTAPTYETFLLAIPRNGVVPPEAVFLWNLDASTGWQLRRVHEMAAKQLTEFCLQDVLWRPFLHLKNLLPHHAASRRRDRNVTSTCHACEWCSLSTGVRIENYLPPGLALFLAGIAARPKSRQELMQELWDQTGWTYENTWSAQCQGMSNTSEPNFTAWSCLRDVRETRAES